MPDTILREKIVVDGTEQAAAKLNVMATAAGRVAHAFSGMGAAAGMLGGIAGVWQIAESIHEVDRLYGAVSRVVNMTELSAASANVLFKQFQLGGIEMEAAERIMTSMTRSAEKMSDGFGGVGMQAMMVKNLMTQIGASAKAGPEERLLAMSKAAKLGKLNIDELIRAFMIPRSQASQMMSMLKQGPERLKEIGREVLKSGALIDDQALASYRKMVQNRRELREAWQDVVGIFYKNLLPGVTAILQGIKKGFDDVKPVAEAIGKALHKHMEMVVKLTKTYLELLLASKAINMFSGPEGKMGIFGRGKQLFQGAMGFMGKRAATAGSMDYFAARDAAGSASKIGGLFSRLTGGAAKAGGGGIGMFETVGGPLTRIMGTVAGRLGIIGVVVTLVITAFHMLKENVWGLGSMFKKTFGGIFEALSGAFSKIMAVLGKLWSAIQPVAQLLAGMLLLQLWIFVKGIEVIAVIINAIATALVAVVNAIIWLLNKIPGVSIDMIGAKDAAKQAAEKAGADNKAGTGTYQDFRGSKFDINNNFPPGIDGGRVAVAFGDELARLGERRLDSGLRPLYSVR